MRLERDRMRPAAYAPTVLVVVPCYNYGRYLPACVESVLTQPDVRVEVLIIDDASTDDSAVVARRLAAADPRVSVIVHPENRGHIATYNEGLSSATTDYVVLLSADDMLAVGALGRATRIMEAHPYVGLVYGHPEVFETDPPPSTARHVWRSVWSGQRWIDLQFRRGLSIIFSPEAVVRTSVHRQVGWYDPALPHSGDLEMWLRLAAVSSVARVNGAVQAYRRLHAASMMQTRFSSPLNDLNERRRAYESFLAGAPLPQQRKDRLRRVMARKLAEEAGGWACDYLRSADVPRSEVERAVQFARSVDPRWEHRSSGREFAARCAGSSALHDRLWVGISVVRQQVARRVQWRRWRYLGF